MVDISKSERARQRKRELDFVSKQAGRGAISSVYGDNLRGIDHRGTGNAIPKNADMHGLTFFTRPDLNLTYDNAAMSRMLLPLLESGDGANKSLARYVRAVLDYRSNRFYGLDCPFVDSQSPFIPLLTNNLLTISGFPDYTVDTYTAPEGIYKEAWSMVDSPSKIYYTYDITANFRNVMGDPITLLFLVWCHYMTMVYEGYMDPYFDNIIENRIDYQTRIYRLVLDRSQTFVQKIAATGAAFPMSSPIGASFNFSTEEPFNQENDQISVPFRCMGAEYQDPILVEEFNATVSHFNPSMHPENLDPDSDGSNGGYVKLTTNQLDFYRYKASPRINPQTHELEWWVPSYILTEDGPGTEQTRTSAQVGLGNPNTGSIA